MLQFASSGFYGKSNAPRRWVAPPATEDSDLEVEEESEVDDSDQDPDYIEEEDLTPTTSGGFRWLVTTRRGLPGASATALRVLSCLRRDKTPAAHLTTFGTITQSSKAQNSARKG